MTQWYTITADDGPEFKACVHENSYGDIHVYVGPAPKQWIHFIIEVTGKEIESIHVYESDHLHFQATPEGMAMLIRVAIAFLVSMFPGIELPDLSWNNTTLLFLLASLSRPGRDNEAEFVGSEVSLSQYHLLLYGETYHERVLGRNHVSYPQKRDSKHVAKARRVCSFPLGSRRRRRRLFTDLWRKMSKSLVLMWWARRRMDRIRAAFLDSSTLGDFAARMSAMDAVNGTPSEFFVHGARELFSLAGADDVCLYSLHMAVTNIVAIAARTCEDLNVRITKSNEAHADFLEYLINDFDESDHDIYIQNRQLFPIEVLDF